MLFIKLKSGECVCISATKVEGAGFPFGCAFKQITERACSQCGHHHKDPGGLSERGPLVMWQVRRQRLGEGAGTAVSPANESSRSQR